MNVAWLYHWNDNPIASIAVHALLFVKACLGICCRTDKCPFLIAMRFRPFRHIIAFAQTYQAVCAVAVVPILAKHMLGFGLNRLRGDRALVVGHYALVLVVVFAGIGID